MFIAATGGAYPPDAAAPQDGRDARYPTNICAQPRVACQMERGETLEQVAGIARLVLTPSCRSYFSFENPGRRRSGQHKGSPLDLQRPDRLTFRQREVCTIARGKLSIPGGTKE